MGLKGAGEGSRGGDIPWGAREPGRGTRAAFPHRTVLIQPSQQVKTLSPQPTPHSRHRGSLTGL